MRCCSEAFLASAHRALALALLLTALFPGAHRAAAAAATGAPLPPAFHASLEVAIEAARDDGGAVLAVFTQDAAPQSTALMQRLKASPGFPAQLGRVHIVEVDVSIDTSPAAHWQVRVIPTLILLDADETILARHEDDLPDDQLQAWVERGCERLRHGLWEGTATPRELEAIATKARSGRLTDAELAQLVNWLGDANPAKRASASTLLLGLRETAIPLLLDAAANPYLGIRISAAELLERLAPERPSIDPWKSPDEEAAAVAAWREWWKATGRLPAPVPSAPPSAEDRHSIENALAALRTQDPARHTDAMSALVRRGPEVLPFVRDALRQAEHAADPRVLGLLEDIRWSVLIPEEVERQAGPLRRVLARGKGPDRQAAVARLAKAGRAGVGALSELLGDPDGLVAEAAVRALSGMGSKEIIPAMAALLKATESNLRMSAARALGHLKDPAVTPALLKVIDDPNELVACTALAGLEEANSKGGMQQSACPPEITGPLQRALADPRWRVRAAAAEVAGKLRAGGVRDTLSGMLSDPDAFAAKSAFEALLALGAAPEIPELSALAKRQPGLRPQVVTSFAKSKSPNASQALLALYKATPDRERLELLHHLAPKKSPFHDDEDIGSNCVPTLTIAAADPDPNLRREVATLISSATFGTITNLVGPLLSDTDEATRSAAARAVLVAVRASDAEAAMRTSTLPDIPELAIGDARSGAPRTLQIREETLLAWHGALDRDPALDRQFRIALAHYVTGHAPEATAHLTASLGLLKGRELQEVADSGWMTSLMQRLTWPGGRPVVEAFESASVLYALALTSEPPPAEGIRKHLADPERLRSALGPTSQEDAPRVVEILLNKQNTYGAPRPLPNDVLGALVQSTNPLWRAFSIHSQALYPQGTNLAVFIDALRDPDVSVRLAGVQGLGLGSLGRDQLETLLAPMLVHSNRDLAMTAAVALLEPEVRRSAELQEHLRMFRFPGITHDTYRMTQPATDLPMIPLDRRPAFLDAVVAQLRIPVDEETVINAVLLAQYGRRDGIDHCLAHPVEGHEENSEFDPLLTGIALLRDPRDVEQVRKWAKRTRNVPDLQKFLRAVKGLSGAEVRQLRLELNRRLRG